MESRHATPVEKCRAMDKLMHRATTNAFLYVENTVYGALGALLAIAALLALGAAGRHLWDAVAAWNTGSAVFSVIERLLLVFMLVEILHTIRDGDVVMTMGAGSIGAVPQKVVASLQAGSEEVAHVV